MPDHDHEFGPVVAYDEELGENVEYSACRICGAREDT